MEKSEPSLVPEWLRSTGGGTGSGTLGHQFASSQADGSSSALAKRNKSSKSIGNSGALHSSFLSRSSSTNSRKSSSSNGSSKHETNTYLRSYNSSTRNQRNKGRETLGITDTWDPEYPDSLASIFTGRIETDTLRRSQSMRKADEFSQRRVCTDMRNNSHSINTNGHGTVAVASSSSTGGPKVLFERDFPVLGSDERPTTPDIVRVPSPVLSKGVQGLSIGPSSLITGEVWTSALAEVPTVAGSNCVTSPTSQHSPYAAATAAAASSFSTPTSSAAGASNGLNMAEALVQTPRTQNVPQQSVQAQRSEELTSLGSKRLIPMTSSSKTLVLNPSDKLKPKTAMRSNEVVSGSKNGLQPMSSLQIGSHPLRSGSARTDGPKAPSAGKLLLLKSTRENALSPAFKDGASQVTNVSGMIVNGQVTGPSGASVLLKNPNSKLSTNDRKTPYNLNVTPVVDKRLSQAQVRSRNDFFNLVRKKSMGSTPATADSGSVPSGLQNSDELMKDTSSGTTTPPGNESELKCNGDTFNLDESSADSKEGVLEDNAVVYPSEEEEAFLRSLGWEDNTGDEGGLTEEEINAFVQKYMKHKPASKLCQNLQLKISTEDP